MVSNIFYVHLHLGKIPNLTDIFQRGWNHQPEKISSTQRFSKEIHRNIRQFIKEILLTLWFCKFSPITAKFFFLKQESWMWNTLQEINISPKNGILSRWFSELPQVGYVNPLEGMFFFSCGLNHSYHDLRQKKWFEFTWEYLITVTDRIIENKKWEKRTGKARPFACGKKNKSGL